ncbi:MAG TPA: twin-arginine translocation signal domain-containing protein [Terriglobales bacterium]|nr:twin-arginine translocation signal domain-containing protein [Terriglobales bacterium]
MDRRRFLKNSAITSAAAFLANPAAASEGSTSVEALKARLLSAEATNVEGHTHICEFKLNSDNWNVYEDLRAREGAITFVSSAGSRVFTKSTEVSFAEESTPYLGLSLKEIGLSPRDLLAERLLEGGNDPDPEQVKSAAPPLGSVQSTGPSWRLPWDTFVGTKECSDTMPIFATGSTRTYHPVQYFPEDNRKKVQKRFDGLVGGWIPAVRKVMPISDTVYDEVIVFGDTEANDKFIVQTWHRTARIENGKITKAVYGYSYPEFPPNRTSPAPEDFYRALLILRDIGKIFCMTSFPHPFQLTFGSICLNTPSRRNSWSGPKACIRNTAP